MKRRKVVEFGISMVIVALMFAVSAAAQAQQNLPDSPAPQNLPDAPSTAKPNPFPSDTAPAPAHGPDQVPENTSSQPAAPAQQPTDEQTQAPATAAPKMPPIRTIPPGSAPRQGSDRDELATFRVTVRSVVVPVTVKDLSGRRVDGLLPKDFTVLENGEPQKIVYFTSDPFPLSAAVVIDLGMSDLAVRKINQTLSALGGAFGQFDEVALYSYSNTVKQQQDFQPAIGEQIAAMLRRMRQTQRGREGGVPVVGGPMQSGPTINGRPADPGNPQVYTRPPEESRVLNDAILRAASDLARRDRSRRKMLFVISDGREYGSAASYKDVLKFLLSNEISVYAVNVDSAAIPGFNKLEGLNLPRTGSANILPKYASATGGQIFREFSQDAIEQAYSDLTSEARNQYTIGYTAPSGNAPTYRSIEVQVHRSGLKVYAKDGYYPLPPAKRAE